MLSKAIAKTVRSSAGHFEKYIHVNSSVIHKPIALTPPVLSIAIPTFRRPLLLEKALKSALYQFGDLPIEVLVVDNDQTPVIAKQVDSLVKQLNLRNITLYRNDKNIGMFGNWNRCLELATGQWITILNDDDILLPNFISTVTKIINIYDEAHLITTGIIIPNKPAGRIKNVLRVFAPNVTQLTLREMVLRNRCGGVLGIVYRRKSAIELGGFDAGCYPVADYVFNLNVLERYQNAYHCKEVCASYGIDPGINTSSQPGLIETYIEAQHAIFEKYNAMFAKHSNLYHWYKKIHAISAVNTLASLWGVQVNTTRLAITLGFEIPTKRISQLFARFLKCVIYWRLRSQS